MINTCHRSWSGVCFLRTVMLFCMMFFLLSGSLWSQETRPRKVVRVACAAFNRLMILGEDNIPISGYAYEYIQTIAVYAGWEVRYIHCGNFAECLNKLLSGEVDLAYDISYTEERARKILFPNQPMGTEFYFLYASAANKSITSGDYAAMNGKTVGITGGTMMIDLLNDWAKRTNVKFKILEYQNISDKEAALYAGKIDLDLEISMLAKHNLSAIEKIGSATYYLAANKARQDLIDDINSALDKILTNDLNYFNRIQDQYFAETTLSRNLTAVEKKWIAKHPVLRVGFFDKYLPFSTKDKNGEPIGAGIEAVREIVRKLNLTDQLKVDFICYSDQVAAYRAVESGEVDLMFPAYISSSVKRDYRIIGGKVL
ncbi:MAG: transporter substrate-binding domain-containing protein, partial [Lentisphaeria bacterium]|nr:transporter substrate-binding domain-containing protein [Lentisphaeria bacterium]